MGHLILIKHVLSTILLHVVVVLEPPQSILKAIKCTFSDFLWKYDLSGVTRTWKSWDKLVVPYDENGLGLQSFKGISTAYSCKLWWKIRVKKGIWS